MTDSSLVTFALFAYNQEKYIRAAAEAALAQDYPNLEIIFSDDCSKDDTFKIMQKVASAYQGPHHVVLNRNPNNLGIAQHFNKVMAQAKGGIVVVAAGDDISLPNRATRTVELLNSVPGATIISFNDAVIDAKGNLLKKPAHQNAVLYHVTLEQSLKGIGPRLSGASRGYRREIFDVFGELNPVCPTEDTPSALRGLMMGTGLYSAEQGIYYRKHDCNLSRPDSLRTMNFEAIFNQYQADLKIAQEKKLISDNLCSLVNKWAENIYQYNLLMKNFHHSKYKTIFFFANIMTSQYITKYKCWEIFRDTIKGKSLRIARKIFSW